MYYQNYEDYMRSVLGYPVAEKQDTYQRNVIAEREFITGQNTKELEECYPKIYYLLHPIVEEVCNKCTVPVTREIVENMVEEVYQKVENNTEILGNMQMEASNPETQQNTRTNYTGRMHNQTIRRETEAENRQRRPNNPLLRDLIRILILNQLLGGKIPNRPPRPRPPYPGPMYRDSQNYLQF